AADGVVSAAGVPDDREQLAGHVRVDAVAGREEDRLRVLHGVRGVVALLGISRVVAEEVDRLLALEVDDGQHLARGKDAAPGPVGGNHDILEHSSCCPCSPVVHLTLLAGSSARRHPRGPKMAAKRCAASEGPVRVNGGWSTRTRPYTATQSQPGVAL